GGGGVVGAEGGAGRKPPRRNRTAGVEAEPAEPEKAGTEDRHRGVVWLDLLLTKAQPPPKDECGHEGRNARADVHDRATGEVEGAELVQPSACAPDPVRDRVI